MALLKALCCGQYIYPRNWISPGISIATVLNNYRLLADLLPNKKIQDCMNEIIVN